MAEMEIGGGGIYAEVDAEGRASSEGFFEGGAEFGFGDDFGCAFFQVGELFIDGFEGCGGHFFVVEDLPSLLWVLPFTLRSFGYPYRIASE